MSAKLLSGKEVSDAILEKTLQEATPLREKGILPTLAIMRVGEDFGSISYEKSIITKMGKGGIDVVSKVFPADVTEEEFVEALKTLNEDPAVHSVLIFKPLPEQISDDVIKEVLTPEKDPDALTPTNMGRLMLSDQSGFDPCTPQGVIRILDHYKTGVRGKDVVIINNSAVLGKPLAIMMTNRFATVTMCHIDTKDTASYTRNADIVVSAVGKYGLVTPDMLREDAILIDVAISVMTDENGEPVLDENGKKVRAGDARVDCKEKVAAMTSATPGCGGGTGAVTTALLAEHVLKACKQQNP